MGKMIEIHTVYQCIFLTKTGKCNHPGPDYYSVCGEPCFPEWCPLRDAQATNDMVLKIYSLVHQRRREAGETNHAAVWNAMSKLADDIDKMRDSSLKDAPEGGEHGEETA